MMLGTTNIKFSSQGNKLILDTLMH